jgi:DeoR/GlpR family transcriptional regulator of sugar metabolism
MANNIAFQPMGNTVLLSCTTTTSNAAITAISPSNQFMIVNTGSVPAFVVLSANSAVTATIANATTNSAAFCVGAGATKVISQYQSNANLTIYAAGITSTSSASVFITPGEGL